MTRRIPVTIVTGFLGSGKTTLLHHVLSNPGGRRIAVLINEFGELGIDGELLKASCGCDDENLIELANGCLCCTVQEEFLPAMLKLMERRERIDHIVIETSGLALPRPLLQAFRWPDLKGSITVDAVVTVADAAGVATGELCDRQKVQAQRLADDSLDHETPIEELFEDQLACADLVLVTKRDLIDDARWAQVRATLEAELPRPVKILPCERGRVDVELLLGFGAAAEDDLANRPSHHDDEEHEHDEEIDAVVLQAEATPRPEVLVAELKRLVAEHGIYRLKGFLHVPGKPMRMVLQGVGERFDTWFDRRWGEGEPRRTRLVAIGQRLEAGGVRERLEAALAAPS